MCQSLGGLPNTFTSFSSQPLQQPMRYVKYRQSSPWVLAQVAVTYHCRLGAETTGTDFSQFWRLEVQGQDTVVRSWLSDGCLLTVSSCGRERRSSGVSSFFYKDTYPITGSPYSWPHLALVTSQYHLLPTPTYSSPTYSPPRTITQGVRASTYGFWRGGGGEKHFSA